MCIKNTSENYGAVAKGFHWAIALLIIFMLVLGFVLADMDKTPERLWWMGIHKSIGVTILALAALRLLWRLVNVIPELPADLDWRLRVMARLTHYALYALMIAMPLSGWLMSSSVGFPVSFFGLFLMPPLIEPNKELLPLFKLAHYWIAVAIIGLVSLHVVAALWHHVVRQDRVLLSMLPRLGRK